MRAARTAANWESRRAERPGFPDRHVGIDRGERSLDLRQHRGRVARDADVSSRVLRQRVASVPLPEIQVRHRIRLLQRVDPLQVFHDADDFNAVGPDDHHAANRPAVRPEVTGQCVVHDGNARTVDRIAVIEFAPVGDADAQRLEVPGTDERRAHLIRDIPASCAASAKLLKRRTAPGNVLLRTANDAE